jgi:hypothetical protein
VVKHHTWHVLLGLSLLSACTPRPGSPWGQTPGSNNPNSHDSSISTPDDTGAQDTGDTGARDTGDTTGPPPDTGTGYGIGDIAFDLTATSQYGKKWSLYSQLGGPIVLLVGHLDVGTIMTQPLSQVGNAASAAGAVSIVLLGRDEYQTVADTTDAARIAEKHGVDVVLTEPSLSLVSVWQGANTPSAYVIDEDMVIQWVGFGYDITEKNLSVALGSR